jgi:glucosylceramidase
MASAQKLNQWSTTIAAPWQKSPTLSFVTGQEIPGKEASVLEVFPADRLQQIEGFGACFNELGWEALLTLNADARTEMLRDLFSAEGVHFTVCRLPLGSNDYSLSYYSYDDVPDDVEMQNFNIDRDRYILIPYIKAAKVFNPNLTLWASPWSPPAWMKVNNHYATGAYNATKRIDEGRFIRNNATAFRMENRYLEAYSLYFAKYVKAYRNEGITVSRVMVQNEPIYQPHWQSCTWRPDDLAYFVGAFLGPRFVKDTVPAEIWLGTVNSPDPAYARVVLQHPEASKYIKGLGVQWDAKRAIATLHTEFPNLPVMQTESECGNGENNWQSAEYTWSLIYQYLSHGANSYMYWNMVLDETGMSTWGWKQNALISIDRKTHAVVYHPEYYLMKHLSHFVQPGAYRLRTSGETNALAFQNPNGDIALLLLNTAATDTSLRLAVGTTTVTVPLKAKSINTFTWSPR